MCEIWWSRSDVFIVNFEYILHIFNTPIVAFEQVNVNWLEMLNRTDMWIL